MKWRFWDGMRERLQGSRWCGTRPLLAREKAGGSL